jgi:signal transduction histidine kinase
MVEAKNFSMRELKLVKSVGKTDASLSNLSESLVHNSERDLFKAIENADGVPFHLEFGSQIGNGIYHTLGSGITRLLGVPAEDLDEKIYTDMIEEVIPLSDDTPSDPVLTRRRFVNGEINQFKAEILIRLASGEKKWISESSLPVIDKESGRVTGSYGILFDITEKKLASMRCKEAKQTAEAEERFQASFLNNISHEIRTPLNAIIGFSTLLGESGIEDENKHEYLELLSRSTDHFLSVMNNIIEISRIEANDIRISKTETNLNSLVQSVYKMMIPKADKNLLTLITRVPAYADNILISTDESKVSQVLIHLVGNAIKFTKSGNIEFGYRYYQGKIEFFVSDTGIGIDLAQQAKIFKRFFQTDNKSTRQHDGPGLGLTISKAYVSMLGGEIWFSSRPGEGSVFYFSIPYEKPVNKNIQL